MTEQHATLYAHRQFYQTATNYSTSLYCTCTLDSLARPLKMIPVVVTLLAALGCPTVELEAVVRYESPTPPYTHRSEDACPVCLLPLPRQSQETCRELLLHGHELWQMTHASECWPLTRTWFWPRVFLLGHPLLRWAAGPVLSLHLCFFSFSLSLG